MTSSSYSVSVIVPVYNGERTIAKCLDSLVQQEYPASLLDIIVVENGSTDRTREIVEKYPVKQVQCERKGPAFARNFGVKVSQAKIIAFTDADCIADPHWLSELIIPYEADETIGGCGGRIEAAIDRNSSFEEIFCQKRNILNNYVSGDHEFLPHLYTANASYRRDVFDQVNGFNANLLTAEDVDLSWRVQLFTDKKIGYSDRAVIYHHHRSTPQALARQYRQYGFGEILIDTLYRQQKNYPRTLVYQLRLMLRQFIAIPRYMISFVIRRVKKYLGKLDAYAAAEPALNIMVEWNNLRGKITGLWATRGMSSVAPVFKSDVNLMIDQFYGKRQ